MFEQFKRLFSSAPSNTVKRHHEEAEQLKLWAAGQGFALHLHAATGKSEVLGFSLESRIGGKPWRLECGLPSRDFIKGEELRFRADLGVLDSVSAVVMNRPLKMTLEKRAFQMYTDSVQTALEPKLPEEMRWLSIYPEAGWANAPDKFWDRYAVLTSKREHAQSWMVPALVDALLSWPEDGPSVELPFTLLLLRGRCYLRMQFEDKDIPTLGHAHKIFRLACQSALENVAQSLQGKSAGS